MTIGVSGSGWLVAISLLFGFLSVRNALSSVCYPTLQMEETDDDVEISEDGKALVRVSPKKVGSVYTVPGSVEVVEWNAFKGCTKLSVLQLHRNVKAVIDNFRDCDLLSEFVVSDDSPYLTSRDGLLYNKSMTKLFHTPRMYLLAEVTLPDSVSNIFRECFVRTRGLHVISLPGSVAGIGPFCFSGKSDLRLFNVSKENQRYQSPDGILVDVVDGVLIRCPPSYESPEVKVPDGVRTIGAQAFSYCGNLSSIHTGESTKEICAWAFSHCRNLKKVYISASVERIACDCFYDCGELEISVSESNQCYMAINGSLYTRSGVLVKHSPVINNGLVKIPEFVKDIGEYAFHGIKGIDCVVVPKDVVYLSRFAFDQGCMPRSMVFKGDFPDGGWYGGWCEPGVVDGCIIYANLSLKRWSALKRLEDRSLKLTLRRLEDCAQIKVLSVPNESRGCDGIDRGGSDCHSKFNVRTGAK